VDGSDAEDSADEDFDARSVKKKKRQSRVLLDAQGNVVKRKYYWTMDEVSASERVSTGERGRKRRRERR
jgi:hypothetical protein